MAEKSIPIRIWRRTIKRLGKFRQHFAEHGWQIAESKRNGPVTNSAIIEEALDVLDAKLADRGVPLQRSGQKQQSGAAQVRGRSGD